MTPCVLGQLDRCTTRGEGKGQDGSFASARGRPLRLGRAGLRQSEGETDGCWAGLDFRPGFSPQSVLLFRIPFLFPNLFIICKLI
jgi:hypothetical protein